MAHHEILIVYTRKIDCAVAAVMQMSDENGKHDATQLHVQIIFVKQMRQ